MELITGILSVDILVERVASVGFGRVELRLKDDVSILGVSKLV